MFRKILIDKGYLFLTFPLAFYWTRDVVIRPKYGGIETISIEEYERKKELVASTYDAFGFNWTPNGYQIFHFIAIAFLVIGCISIGKMLLSKSK